MFPCQKNEANQCHIFTYTHPFYAFIFFLFVRQFVEAPFFIPFFLSIFFIWMNKIILFVTYLCVCFCITTHQIFIFLFVFGLLYANNITCLDATCLLRSILSCIIDDTNCWLMTKQIAHFFILFIIHYVSLTMLHCICFVVV